MGRTFDRLALPVLLGWLACLPVLGLPGTAHATVPADFEDRVLTKVGAPTALAFTPDGRMLIVSQRGTLHVFKNGAQNATPALDITARVCSDKERGLVGVAVDPQFTINRYIY